MELSQVFLKKNDCIENKDQKIAWVGWASEYLNDKYFNCYS